MKMQVQRVNVVAFTRKIMENFDSVAEEHHIDFLFETEKPELYLWVDVDKYEKIISTCSPMLSSILRMENDKGFYP